MIESLGRNHIAITQRGVKALRQKFGDYPLTGSVELEEEARRLPEKVKRVKIEGDHGGYQVDAVQKDSTHIIQVLVERQILDQGNGDAIQGNPDYVRFNVANYDCTWGGLLKLSAYFEVERAQGPSELQPQVKPTSVANSFLGRDPAETIRTLSSDELQTLLKLAREENSRRNIEAAKDYLNQR